MLASVHRWGTGRSTGLCPQRQAQGSSGGGVRREQGTPSGEHPVLGRGQAVPRRSCFFSHSPVQRADQSPDPDLWPRCFVVSSAPCWLCSREPESLPFWSWRCPERDRWRAQKRDATANGTGKTRGLGQSLRGGILARACDRSWCQDPHPAMSARLGAHSLPTTPFGPKAR